MEYKVWVSSGQIEKGQSGMAKCKVCAFPEFVRNFPSNVRGKVLLSQKSAGFWHFPTGHPTHFLVP